jgi:acyl-coenzyme A thioesterase PaaI-like protein
MHHLELMPADSEVVIGIIQNPQSFISGLVANGVLKRTYHVCAATRRIVALVELVEKCQGPLHHVHGGLIASLLDEVMAVVLLHQKKLAVTGRLKVDFLNPCPFPASYRLEAWMDESDTLSAVLKARMVNAEGKEMASAHARFIWVD